MKKGLIVAALMLAGCAQEFSYPVPVEDALDKIEVPAGSDMMTFPNGGYGVDVAFENNVADRVAVWTYTYGGKEVGKLMAGVGPAGDNASKVPINFVDGTEELDARGTSIRRLLESDQLMVAKEAIAASLENRPPNEGPKRQFSMDLAALDVGKVMRDLPQMQHDALQSAAQTDRDMRDYEKEEHDRRHEQEVNPNGFGQAPDQRRY